jgi:hypothetical protein
LRVRITETPREEELDGVRLDGLTRGSVREVSSSIGAWLVAEGYAEPEMRQGPRQEDLEFSGVKSVPHAARDRRHRRRSTDR